MSEDPGIQGQARRSDLRQHAFHRVAGPKIPRRRIQHDSELRAETFLSLVKLLQHQKTSSSMVHMRHEFAACGAFSCWVCVRGRLVCAAVNGDVCELKVHGGRHLRRVLLHVPLHPDFRQHARSDCELANEHRIVSWTSTLWTVVSREGSLGIISLAAWFVRGGKVDSCRWLARGIRWMYSGEYSRVRPRAAPLVGDLS